MLRDLDTGAESVEAGVLFALIGSEPRTDWLAGTLARDRWGFLVTGTALLEAGTEPTWALDRSPAPLETSTPGVFAAGDVRAVGEAGRLGGRRGRARGHPRARAPRANRTDRAADLQRVTREGGRRIICSHGGVERDIAGSNRGSATPQTSSSRALLVARADRRRTAPHVMPSAPGDAGEPGHGGSPIRVATVPHSDAYVEAVLPHGSVHVGPAAEPSPWLDAEYLTAHASDVDVLHVHAGYEHLDTAVLEGWTEAVRRCGVPLVVTVHQLRDPAHPDATRHLAHLEALLSTAELVLTLTPGAAEEIAFRFGRTPIVVAHPSIAAPVPDLGAERGLVGVFLGPASPAVPDPLAVVRSALSGAVSGGGRLRVLVQPDDVAHLHPGIQALADDGDLELVVHDGDRVAALQQLHVAVLPQRCGTHSRDLEVCRDVGTRVVAPGCGWFADQWSDVVTYSNDEAGGLDPVSLTVAITAALARPMPRPADRAWRADQRAAVQRVHADVYRQVAADRSAV